MFGQTFYLGVYLTIVIPAAFAGPDAEAKEDIMGKSAESETEVNPLMSMIKNRTTPAAPSKESENPAASEEETKPADPRAALMTMLKSRAPPDEGGEETTEPSSEKEEKAEDPRAALMTMLKSRASPAGTKDPKPDSSPESEEKKEDTRATLMTMLQNRAPPVQEEEDAAKDTGKSLESGQEEVDPISVLQDRAPPASPEEPKNETVQSTQAKEGDDDHDPKAALNAMLSKRATQAPEAKKDAPGFFPATTRDINKSARGERYEAKTSSDARGNEDVQFPSPPSSPAARGIRQDLLEARRSSLHHVGKMPILDDHEKDKAASDIDASRKRANRINPSIEADAKTEAKVMLVAAMAAAAAKKRNQKAKDDSEDVKSKSPKNPVQKAVHPDSAKDESSISKGSSKKSRKKKAKKDSDVAAPMGIAAMAAAAARKKNDATPTVVGSIQGNDVGTATLSNNEQPSLAESVGDDTTNKTENPPPEQSAVDAGTAKEPDIALQPKSDDKVDTVQSPVNVDAVVEDVHVIKSSQPPASNVVVIDGTDSSVPVSSADASTSADADTAKKDTGNLESTVSKNAVAVTSVEPPPNTSTANLYPCSACAQKLDKDHFSKNQLAKTKKTKNGRCKKCIESSG